MKTDELIDLDVNGISYKKDGLPERIILKALENGKNFTLKELRLKTGIPGPEMSACLGILKGKAALDMLKDDANNLLLRLTGTGERLAKKELLEEVFLKQDFPIPLEQLKPEDKSVMQSLRKRRSCIKIIKRK